MVSKHYLCVKMCADTYFQSFQVLCAMLSMRAVLWCWISKPCWLLSGQHLILQWIVVVWWMQPGIKLGTQVGLNSSLASLLSHRPFSFWEMQSHSPLTKDFVFIEKFYLLTPSLCWTSRSIELGRLQYSVKLFWKTRMYHAWGKKRVEGESRGRSASCNQSLSSVWIGWTCKPLVMKNEKDRSFELCLLVIFEWINVLKQSELKNIISFDILKDLQCL